MFFLVNSDLIIEFSKKNHKVCAVQRGGEIILCPFTMVLNRTWFKLELTEDYSFQANVLFWWENTAVSLTKSSHMTTPMTKVQEGKFSTPLDASPLGRIPYLLC